METAFLSIKIPAGVKVNLQQEAEQNDVSLSVIVRNYLRDAIGPEMWASWKRAETNLNL